MRKDFSPPRSLSRNIDSTRSLDLTGLPPTTIAEIDAFLADTDPHAYEHLVDRLLASPHYGERMTLDWLDAARFADTNVTISTMAAIWTRWRAWVIDAYNRNLPLMISPSIQTGWRLTSLCHHGSENRQWFSIAII